MAERVQTKVNGQQETKHSHSRTRDIQVDNPVYIREFANGRNGWIPGIVMEKRGDKSFFFVELPDGRVVHRHIDHVRRRSNEVPRNRDQEEDDMLPEVPLEKVPTFQTQQPRRSTRNRGPPDRLQM